MDKLLRVAVGCVFLTPLQADRSFAKGWHGIVPLRSTRADVARLYKRLTGASLFGVGLPGDSFNIIGEGMVGIQYSLGRCVEGWKVKKDTVVRVSVHLTNPVPFADMRAELENLPRSEDDAGALYYWNDMDGIQYVIQDERVTSITYGVNEDDERSLACQKARY